MKIGDTIGRRTITDNAGITGSGKRRVHVRCTCGREDTVLLSALRFEQADRCASCKQSQRGMTDTKRHNVRVACTAINTMGRPMKAAEIVSLVGGELKTRSRTPVNVLQRDIAVSILDSEPSPIVRVGVGLYATAEMVRAEQGATVPA